MGFIKRYSANIAVFLGTVIAGILIGQITLAKIALVVLYLAILASNYYPQYRAKAPWLDKEFALGAVKFAGHEVIRNLFIGALLATSAGILASLQSLFLAVLGGIILFCLVLAIAYFNAIRSDRK